MKTTRLVTLCAILALAAGIARADAITVITNYFPGYVAVTSGWETVENSGLSTNTAYVCIPLATLSALSATQAEASSTNSDVRALMYAINDQMYTAYAATASTNRPANAEVAKASAIYSATELLVQHTLKTRLTLVTTSITPE